ncbi:MAG: DsbA family protein [Clostridiales bacterium]|nr:DsbA family protein [Clostridiales bacterium]
MKDIIITSFTDPVCVWCYATEPVMRAIEMRYPQVEIRYIMGGMVRDFNDFEDPDNDIMPARGGVNEQVMAHWLQSYPRHHMPIRAEGFHLFDEQHSSTYSQSIACKAAQLAAPRRAEAYLRALRVAAIAQARQISRPKVQLEIARECAIPIDTFQAAMQDGSAKRAFQVDLGLTQASGVDVFPTFMVKSSRAQEMKMRGFNTFEDFEQVFKKLSGGDMTPLISPPDEELLESLLSKYGNLAMEEIYQAFDFESRSEAEDWVSELARKGMLTLEPVGKSFFTRLANKG